MIQLPKLDWPLEPYRGIEQFRFIDRPIFFERQDETRRLVRLVSIYRGTLLFGESGTGKSSVINAGFIPAMLEEGFLAERLRVQPLPGRELVVERIALTNEGTAPFLPSRFAADDEPATRLVFSTEDLRARLSNEHPGGPPLLIFDQFEEFITLFEEAPESREKLAEATQAQKNLLDFFHDLLRDETLPVKLLFVFREDYLAKLSKLFALVPNLRDQHVRLTFPDSSVLKTLIRGPFTQSEIPPEHFVRIISDELADKLGAALEEQSETGSINLTEVQIACLSLWRDPKANSLFDAAPNRAEVVQRLLEDHLTGALNKLASGLREPAIAVLRCLVTSAGTRNIVLEADLLERMKKSEDVPLVTGKRALDALSGQSGLVRRQRRNEAYFYDITSEFLVPWIQRQRGLSDARAALRKWRKIVIALFVVAVVAVSLVQYSNNKRLAAQKEEATKREQEDEKKLETKQNALTQTVVAYEKRLKNDVTNNEQKIPDSVKDKEGITSDTETQTQTEPETPGADAPPPTAADISHAVDFVTDKIFVHKAVVWTGHYSGPQFVPSPGTPNTFLITASGDKTAGVWDLKSDKDFFLRGHTGEVNGAIFNPKTHADGSGWLAATASDDKNAALWKASAPDKPLFLKGHTGAVTGLAWSGDGNWLVTTSTDQQVRIWNIAANDPSKEPRVLKGHSGSVWQACLVENGGNGWLVTPSNDKTARLWTFPQGEPVHFSGSGNAEPGVLHHGSAVRRAAMDSQGRWIVTAGADGHAILWDRVTGKQLLFINHEKPVRDVVFKPGGTLFVTASADGTAQVWDAKKNLGIVTLQGHTAPVFSARFTPFGPGVVTVSWDRTARLWNYETKTCVAVLRGHGDVLWSVEFSPSGTNFTTTSGDGTARLWDLKRIPGGEAFLPPPSAAK